MTNPAPTSADPPSAVSSHQVQDQDKIGYGEEPEVADFTMHNDGGGGLSASHDANGDRDHTTDFTPSMQTHSNEPEPFGANIKEDG